LQIKKEKTVEKNNGK